MVMDKDVMPGDDPVYVLPGGPIRTGDTAEAAAVRVLHQMGIDVKPMEKDWTDRGVFTAAGPGPSNLARSILLQDAIFEQMESPSGGSPGASSFGYRSTPILR